MSLVEHYSRVDSKVVGADASIVALLKKGTSTPLLLDRSTADFLFSTRGFKAISAHLSEYRSAARRLSPHGPSDDERSAANMINRLIAEGQMISVTDWLHAVAVESETLSKECTPRISHVGIVTKCRPHFVRQSLESLAASLSADGRICSLCVCDDSTDDRTCDVVEKARHTMQRQGLAIEYIGPLQKDLRIRRLIRHGGVPPNTIRYVLGQQADDLPAFGENINWLLLHTHGTLAVCVDDDVIPGKVVGHKQLSEGLRLSSAPDDREVHLYPNRQEALQSVTPLPFNVISAHEHLLGRSIHECIRLFGPPDVTHIGPSFMTTLLDEPGRVLATMSGVAGDAGSSKNWCLASKQFRDRWGLAAETNTRILDSHDVLSAVPRLTISDRPIFMNYACGFDNRRLLPPVLPAGRGSDYVFGTTLRRCFSSGYIGHLPWAVVHDPPSRDWKANSYLGPRVSELLVMALNSSGIVANPVDPGATVTMLGVHLKYIADLPMKDFEEWLRVKYCAYLLDQIMHLDSLMASDQPELIVWRNYCQSYASALRAELRGLKAVCAADLRSGRTAEEALFATKRTVGSFADMMRWWPDLLVVSAEVGGKYGPITTDV